MTPSPSPEIRLREQSQRDEESVLGVTNILLRRRRFVVAVPVVLGLGTLLICLILPPTYTARTTFVPDAEGVQTRLPGSLAGLAGLAGQFGVSLGGDASRSPRFYADVTKSREL